MAGGARASCDGGRGESCGISGSAPAPVLLVYRFTRLVFRSVSGVRGRGGRCGTRPPGRALCLRTSRVWAGTVIGTDGLTCPRPRAHPWCQRDRGQLIAQQLWKDGVGLPMRGGWVLQGTEAETEGAGPARDRGGDSRGRGLQGSGGKGWVGRGPQLLGTMDLLVGDS